MQNQVGDNNEEYQIESEGKMKNDYDNTKVDAKLMHHPEKDSLKEEDNVLDNKIRYNQRTSNQILKDDKDPKMKYNHKEDNPTMKDIHNDLDQVFNYAVKKYKLLKFNLNMNQ